MNQVSIQIPSELFCAIYSIFQGSTQKVITDALQNLVNENLPVGNFKEGHTVNIEIPWPNSNTKEYRVWKICQEILAEYNGLLTANHKELVIQRCSQQGIHINTANTNYSNWKRFWNASQKVSQA